MTAPRPAEEPTTRLRELVEEIVVAPGWREELREAAAAVERERDEARKVIGQTREWVETFDCDCFGGTWDQDAERCDRCTFLARFATALADAPVPPQPEPERCGNCGRSVPGEHLYEGGAITCPAHTSTHDLNVVHDGFIGACDICAVHDPEPERCEHGLTEAHHWAEASWPVGQRTPGARWVDCPGPVSPQSTEETGQ